MFLLATHTQNYFYVYYIHSGNKKTVVTQTYQIITKHTQHNNKLIIHMITLVYKYNNSYYYRLLMISSVEHSPNRSSNT